MKAVLQRLRELGVSIDKRVEQLFDLEDMLEYLHDEWHFVYVGGGNTLLLEYSMDQACVAYTGTLEEVRIMQLERKSNHSPKRQNQ